MYVGSVANRPTTQPVSATSYLQSRGVNPNPGGTRLPQQKVMFNGVDISNVGFGAPRFNPATGGYEGGGVVNPVTGQAVDANTRNAWIQSLRTPSNNLSLGSVGGGGNTTIDVASLLGGGQSGTAQPGAAAPSQPGANPQSGYGSGYGLQGSEAALLGGLGQAQDTIGSGYDAAADLVTQYGQKAGEGLQSYADQGASSSQLQAALSGALGPEAQAEAYANFQSSPGQDYLRQQAEKSLLRNASAIGGLGGGNVRSALQEQAIGMAAQDFDNSFNHLTGITDRGFNAAQLLSGIDAGVGDRLADLETERAGTVAGMQYGTGGNLANYRTRAGEGIAGNYGNTTSQLAQIQQQFGNQLSQQLGSSGGLLAQLLGGSGQADAQITQQLAALLANIATGSGSQAAGLPGIPGTQQTNGMIDDLLKVGAFLSDARLKTNIRRVGRMPSGVNLYSWDWNSEGRRLTGEESGVGVIAQEVPWASIEGPEGYLMVDYRRV